MIALVTPKELLKATDTRIIEKLKEFIPEHLKKGAVKFLLYIINTVKKPSLLLKSTYFAAVLPSRFLDSHFEGIYRRKDPNKPSVIEELIENKLIQRSTYSRQEHLAREFSIEPELLLKLILYADSVGTTLEPMGAKNPVTNTEGAGVALASLDPSSVLYKAINYKYYDVLYIERLQKYITDRYKKLIIKRQNSNKPNNKQIETELKSISSDYFRYIGILQRGEKDSSGVWNYKRMFNITSTGRIVEINGGLQGLSRSCKEYIYKDIPFIYNYDLANSQLVLLSYFCKKLNIDSNWIDTYTNNKNLKITYAKHCGMSKDTWKRCLLSLVFGSNTSKWGTPWNLILNESGKNKQKAQIIYEKWLKITEPLQIICKNWLTQTHTYAISTSVNGIATNAVGITLDLKAKKYSNKFLSSWFLQGLESAIIYNLTIFPEATYKVCSNEYDGIVTVGQIPTQTFQTVLKNLDLENSGLKLEIKSFV